MNDIHKPGSAAIHQHDHAHHGQEAGHSHDHPGPHDHLHPSGRASALAAAPTEFGFSLLRLSALARIGLAVGLVSALWLLILWAMA